jgi:hypothetical protein
MDAMRINSISKSKRYLCWQRRRHPQRMNKYASSPPPCRLDIIFDLELGIRNSYFIQFISLRCAISSCSY